MRGRHSSVPPTEPVLFFFCINKYSGDTQLESSSLHLTLSIPGVLYPTGYNHSFPSLLSQRQFSLISGTTSVEKVEKSLCRILLSTVLGIFIGYYRKKNKEWSTNPTLEEINDVYTGLLALSKLFVQSSPRDTQQRHQAERRRRGICTHCSYRQKWITDVLSLKYVFPDSLLCQ